MSTVDNSNNNIDDDDNAVRVAVRIRPFLPEEPTTPYFQISPHALDLNGNRITNGQISITGTPKCFTFDLTFPSTTNQKQLYSDAVSPLITACLKGYNATVLAYGQTGSGKTFTILGGNEPGDAETFEDEKKMDMRPISAGDKTESSKSNKSLSSSSKDGIIPRALKDLFNRLEKNKRNHAAPQTNESSKRKKAQKQPSLQGQQQQAPYEYEVRIQFLELYGEQIRDLLTQSHHAMDTNKLVIRDGGRSDEPEVIGASEVKVSSAEEALLCLTRGMLRRVTGETAMNKHSSRSHAIITVIVEQTSVTHSDSDMNVQEEMEQKRSKFHFVDLAGSERQKRSQAQGQRLKEGIDINKGLLVLGNVISALGDTNSKKNKAFVPYRDSKLTRLLKGSLGGNHKTLMIACVSPSSINMEESLNCLRYANRAKNIENNAVVNLDAGSKLVGTLRSQVKALAGELLRLHEKYNEGNESKAFKLEDLRALARGEVSERMDIGEGSVVRSPKSKVGDIGHRSPSDGRKEKANHEAALKSLQAEVSKLKSTNRQLKNDFRTKSEELFAAKAESEYHRMHSEKEDEENNKVDKQSEELKIETANKRVFMNRCRDYERQISLLKKQLANVNAQSAIAAAQREIGDNLTATTASSSESKSLLLIDEGLNNNSPPKRGRDRIRRERPGKTISHTVDKEHDDEESEISKITSKYLKYGNKEQFTVDEDDDENKDDDMDNGACSSEDEDETFQTRQSHMNAHVTQLSRGIAAKEELVEQLERSQVKYEKMRSFYQDKMKKMTMQLSVQEAEKMNLETELKKFETNSEKHKDLQEALDQKQKHIDHLKKRQTELKNLTSIASRNENVIHNLSKEIQEMKKQKDGLQKQLIKERKEHAQSLQQLEKKALSEQRSVKRLKEQLAITIAQKQRVQDIAKSRAEEVSALRSKYQDAEKKLRMKTLKQGVMERAGIDPILVGRHDKRKMTSRSSSHAVKSHEKQRAHSSADIHQMRTFLDEKIADISRKEALADKLAHEWEDHLELTTRKEQTIIESKSRPSDSNLADEVEALDFQIMYKESRIRQLAQRLGQSKALNGRKNHSFLQDTLIDDRKLRSITSELTPLSASQLTSKVLFGMVVKERRRVATLARAASALDQKAVKAEKLVASKEAALRSMMEESKNDKVKMAQQNQDRILSLMELVQDEGQEGRDDALPKQSDTALLRFANERIETLEEQLINLEKEKESRVDFEEREKETVAELTKLTYEYSQLLNKSKALRGSLRKIREKVSLNKGDLDSSIQTYIMRIIDDALHTGKTPKENTDRKTIISPFDSDSDEEEIEEKEVPEWAGHIMKDLAIIAAGDVPAILKTPRERNAHRRPPTPGGSVFDRLSSPDNFTSSHNERISDNNSVGSNQSRARSRSRARSVSSSRYNTSTEMISNQETPPRNISSVKSFKSPSPFRVRPQSPASTPNSRLSQRVTAILKDGPPKILTVPTTPVFEDDHSLGSTSYRSLGSHSQQSQRRKTDFVRAYTKKDVFERLQKKHTNSYTYAVQASATIEK